MPYPRNEFLVTCKELKRIYSEMVAVFWERVHREAIDFVNMWLNISKD